MRSECIPPARLPHLSRLFSDFLTNFHSVGRYYGSAPFHFNEMRLAREYPEDRRRAVVSVLETQNKRWGASKAALENIERLRSGASAIVTGQQVGLFGGPLYAMLKALTAIKLAEKATLAGKPTVPVFWLATEDHDLAEVAHAGLVNEHGHLQKITAMPKAAEGTPVGEVEFSDEITAAVNTAAGTLGNGEALDLLRKCYASGVRFGDAFARLFAQLFGEFGLVLVDNADAELHAIALPVYSAAAKEAGELNKALQARSKQLEKDGYAAQVKVSATHTLLFRKVKGLRTLVTRSNGGYSIGGKKLTQDELEKDVAAHPLEFTPNALLRPVVQDFLLPTIAYVGGPAEVAYFAQSAVVYERILCKATPIVPRVSATIVSQKVARKLEKFGMQVAETFRSEDELRKAISVLALPDEMKERFSQAEATINATVASLKELLQKADPTLMAAADRSARKMQYQIGRLRQRAGASESRRREEITRQAQEISGWLYPHGVLQEREVAGIQFLALHGRELLNQVYEAINPECMEHQVLFL
jgi:bacillithiol biosynthesis cysteine-adding enzyme BshC